MNDQPTLRDWLAMNAPFIQALSTGSSDEDMKRHAKERFRYADIALKVRAETMPKPEIKHPEWAKWATRDKSGRCCYFQNEPYLDKDMWVERKTTGQLDHVEGDTSFIPTDWRISKVKLK